jgi:cytochrome P450
MTREEIMKSAGLIIIAGSETSATLLSGAFFYLLRNPGWYAKLQNEIVESFQDESEITFASLAQLKVLNAVIQETFRMYPPVPTTLPRLTSKAGAMVCGIFTPPNTSIGIAQWPAYRSAKNFRDPHVFAPERFLGDPKVWWRRKERRTAFLCRPKKLHRTGKSCYSKPTSVLHMCLTWRRILRWLKSEL